MKPTPAEPDPIHLDAYQVDTDGEYRRVWFEQIEDLLPEHTHRTNGNGYTWTNPYGTWHLELRVYEARNGRAVNIRGPRGEWQPRDHRPGPLGQLLRALEAIE